MRLRDKISHWTIGRKDGIGTALSDCSHVYFTIGRGRPTEIYFPSPDNIVIHSITLFSEGKIPETESEYETETPYDFAPFYRVASKQLQKEIITNPEADELLVKYMSKTFKNTLKIAFPVIISSERNEEAVFVQAENARVVIRLNVPFRVEIRENYALICVSSRNFLLRIAFGDNKYGAENSLPGDDFEDIKEKFVKGWANYVGSLHVEGKDWLYKRSIIAIKSAEDKVRKGAAVASLAIPWGSKMPLTERNGYHLVWVRDLFFSAIAMYLAGDEKFANASLEYMLAFLRRADGSFKQNATINGEERWSATQMDQVAFPILLANFLKRSDLTGILGKSADYIVKNGPWTEQERWEEMAGYSPYAMSLQWRALKLYGKMVKGEKRKIYEAKAEEFERKIPVFCFTENGKYPPYEYFVRISKGNPDKDTMYLKGAHFTPKEMISADFLYLTFTGLYDPENCKIKNSVKAVDNLLRVETPLGPSFYRYNGDIYGFDGKTPKGRLWPILTAERGMYEILRNGNPVKYITALRNFASFGGFLPEQVFEDGSPTESVAPLTWSHASYIILSELAQRKSKRIPFL